MSYQKHTQPAIPVPRRADQLNPETTVKSFLWTILAPCAAALGIALVMFAPSPKDIAIALKPIGTPLEVVNGGDPNERESIKSLADRFELAVGPELGKNSDCFDDLRLADNSKLERCGRLVYQALAEVNESPMGFPTDVAQSVSSKELMQELKLAATEVCRERWSRDGTVPKDSPACEVALAQAIDRDAD